MLWSTWNDKNEKWSALKLEPNHGERITREMKILQKHPTASILWLLLKKDDFRRFSSNLSVLRTEKKRAGTFVKNFFDIEAEDMWPSWREKIVWTGISGYWCGLHSDITKIVNVAQIKVVFYDGDTLSNCIISSFFCCKKNSRKRYD